MAAWVGYSRDWNGRRFEAKVDSEDETLKGDEEELAEGHNVPSSWILSAEDMRNRSWIIKV